MPTVKLLDARKLPSRRPDRLGRMDTLVIYQVDGLPTAVYSALVPHDEPTDAQIEAAVRADLDLRKRQIGRTFTL